MNILAKYVNITHFVAMTTSICYIDSLVIVVRIG